MTWTDTEAALWELKAMGVGPEQVWRDPDGHVRGDAYGATADEMRRIAALLDCLDAGRAPLPKGPAGPARFEALNSFDVEKRVWAWLQDGAEGLKLTLLDRLVLVSLARYANSKTGEAWPGDKILAAICGVDKGSVDRSLGRLRAVGLIESRAGGRKHRTRHTLVGLIHQPTGEAIHTDTSTPERDRSTPERDTSTEGLTGSRRNKEKAGAEAAFSPNGRISTKVLAQIESKTGMGPGLSELWASVRLAESENRGKRVVDANAYIVGCLKKYTHNEIPFPEDDRATMYCPECGRRALIGGVRERGYCFDCLIAKEHEGHEVAR